jgi:hypothetical protein
MVGTFCITTRESNTGGHRVGMQNVTGGVLAQLNGWTSSGRSVTPELREKFRALVRQCYVVGSRHVYHKVRRDADAAAFTMLPVSGKSAAQDAAPSKLAGRAGTVFTNLQWLAGLYYYCSCLASPCLRHA